MDKKNVVRQRFRDEMNLVVDMPKTGGSSGSTTNDGNTARRAFKDTENLN